jgi:penicillin-binding protein 1C
LKVTDAANQRFAVLSREGEPMALSYNGLNMLGLLPLHAVPPLLQQAMVTAEDRRFFAHHGVDWQARLSALWQNIRAEKSVRGASTITEQVVRIVHPRARNLWSRWLEGWEAMLLERQLSKGEILEFYLNHVPYAANRRGVAQAARYYFNRDVDTLTAKEMLALAVLPRAPSALDLYRKPEAINAALERLTVAMRQRGELSAGDVLAMSGQQLVLQPPAEPVEAAHFIRYVRETVPYGLSDKGVVTTTLDAGLQRKAQLLLDERLRALARKHVLNGAVLVADHETGEVLAWVVAGAGGEAAGHAIDAVRVARQPGSSLKPFLYALALDSGWTAATVLEDAPLSEAIGAGLHDFHNYSHQFYGMVSLREALGNSLNIPALKTVAFVQPARYLATLHMLGFSSLSQSADFYREGLALGNGEVTLLEMVQGYNALAHHGVFRPLKVLPEAPLALQERRVYSDMAASLIGNILSDAHARRQEFGAGSVLNLPVQTAVKTGTSNDYHDAWVLGFDAHYTVGVWMGNLDNSPMDGVTGAVGPALVLRGIFAELAGTRPSRPLYMSPALVAQDVCSGGGVSCYAHTEYFMAGTGPEVAPDAEVRGVTLVRPSEGLLMAYDPRVPADAQAFEFVAKVPPGMQVEWLVDGVLVATTDGGHWVWPLSRGKHLLVARAAGEAAMQDTVHFQVK